MGTMAAWAVRLSSKTAATLDLPDLLRFMRRAVTFFYSATAVLALFDLLSLRLFLLLALIVGILGSVELPSLPRNPYMKLVGHLQPPADQGGSPAGI
jgi:hypothetical protein